MQLFMDQDFLLRTQTARRLFHEHAEAMPIIDYHCHISPKEIWENRRYRTITEAWLEADHYKWRAIRSNGTDESLITGDADDLEKFRAYAAVMDRCIGNPLYHWTHLELQRYFGYHGALSAQTADEVYALCNEKLKDEGMRVRGLIEQSNVKVICSTDDPTDDLFYHQQLAADETFTPLVLPTFRPDRALAIDAPGFLPYIDELSRTSDVHIADFTSLCEALERRVAYFVQNGCRASDHSLGNAFFFGADETAAEKVFIKARGGETVSAQEAGLFRSALLVFLGRCYHRHGWVMQLHMGPVRNASSRMYGRLGADAGFDCIGSAVDGVKLVAFLNELDRTDELPKTILYSLNPNDNIMLGSVIGCFQTAQARGKLQHGSAWWFNDTKHGMQAQLEDLASTSLLGNFIGMLTDSRSFLSYTRHEYFRRILCDFIGRLAENGEYAASLSALGGLVEDISYNNVRDYFQFPIG